ncbi:MAG: hypothetical protein KJ550_11425 [Proteobacteria bacterium]|nr:hypothetical protein [Desulfobacteraceae bacterium]MBU4014065.1 hypothetical protein [Pseudomonadota bacterium]MBU4069055.1 hypothetical protein [Pseudomonadota bacterium]MBU4100099.1 hypothetical protein [Pseudomonadota bacterium]MBU4127627.1 hypothetical protein [Pseudomonadota bacterium]
MDIKELTREFIRLLGRKLIYLLMFAAGILLFMGIGIYSSKKFSEIKGGEIKAIRCQIEGQMVVLPVYKELLKKLQVKGSEVLPFPDKNRLPKDKIEEIPKIFEGIAKNCNLESVSIIPDVMSLDRTSGLLLVNTFVKGSFFDFRKFLVNLGGISYLERIEKIDIKRTMEGKEFGLKIWIALSLNQK